MQQWSSRESCSTAPACTPTVDTSVQRAGVVPREEKARSRRSAVARWTSCSTSPYAAQTPLPPTNPGRPPQSRHTDALAESWYAALHQGVSCAQRQDVVVAHQPGGGDHLRINSLRRVERKCRLRWSGAVPSYRVPVGLLTSAAGAAPRLPRRLRRQHAAVLARKPGVVGGTICGRWKKS